MQQDFPFLMINGQEASSSYWNRALLYGDGIFETVLWVNGQSSMWPWHWQRLDRGCQQLGLRTPDEEELLAECREAVSQSGISFNDDEKTLSDTAVIRLTIFRDHHGQRGYSSARVKETQRLISVHPVPPRQAEPLSVGLSTIRLGWQPLLGGLKHLNRIEQVLAASECEKHAWDEALMLDQGGRLISAVSGNLIFRMGDVWMTSPIDRCGVAGVCRQWLLDEGPLPLQICTIKEPQLERLNEIWITNSVRGARPVTEFLGRKLAISDDGESMADSLQRQLWAAAPSVQ